MICLECSKLDLPEGDKYSNAGLGRCKHKNLPGVFVSIAYHRDCPQFVEAKPEIAAARIEWYQRSSTKGEGNGS